MYIVIGEEDIEFETLDLAMQHAKELGVFVTILYNDMEICGMFGVDSVDNGIRPDGTVYDWRKRR